MKIPAGVLEATRLVRGGKLMEATAVIQRALGGQPSTAMEASDSNTAVIEGSWRVIEPVSPEPTRPSHAADAHAWDATAPKPRHGGRFVTGTYTNSAGTRAYKTYIPAMYDGQAVPLVVMLHGCKQNPDDFAAGTRMNALAEEHGFLVVYPAQAAEANVSKCWNWFQSKDQKRDHGEPSLIAGITREVIAAYRLDGRRVFVAGLSAGGAMGAIMATNYPELYAAVGIHSGLAYAAASDLPSAFAAMRGHGKVRRRKTPRGGHRSSRTVPTIVFHGDSDTTVHPSNGEEVIARGMMASSAVQAQHETDARITVENGNSRGRTYTRTIHRDASGKHTLEHWVVHGAGHAWSGGSAEGSFTDVKGPDASREMLRFFLQAH
ncbi:MAG: extracellular catalytic domain type 1 short-chain-length polyhydroxyalkanoate depolymerase [Burkholderiales bacterium]